MSKLPPHSLTLPPLPLLLWQTPPALEMVLSQEGVPFRKIVDPHPLAFQGGRFVLFDARQLSSRQVRERLSPDHTSIDVSTLLRSDPDPDSFTALLDSSAVLSAWSIRGCTLTERIARHPRGIIRERIVDALRLAITAAGGLWARLAPYPYPYRSAFNLRVDLDEPVVEDYARFARARRNLADCCTHFVSTAAYGDLPAILQDLMRFDTQSHGHYHVIYRDRDSNRRNLHRAHEILRDSGFEPEGFAAPHGRWNHGLDRVIEEMGYRYSSDFQVGYDDLPFFPWVGDRFSSVLQVPIHPICEGLFFEAGEARGVAVGDYLAEVVREKIRSGEPAFVYGHPERRLAHHPIILNMLEDAIAAESLLWRVTLTEFARWWHWRSERRWAIFSKPDGRFEVQFEDWDETYPAALEVIRGRHRAILPLAHSRTSIRLEDLAYEALPAPSKLPAARPVVRAPSLKQLVREALDWETVTPVHDLQQGSFAGRMKKGLRLWRELQNREAER